MAWHVLERTHPIALATPMTGGPATAAEVAHHAQPPRAQHDTLPPALTASTPHSPPLSPHTPPLLPSEISLASITMTAIDLTELACCPS
ncbi:hypothetical protein GCM10017788_48370 [Amycolatopsis acidiphila]|nr:hypothetical protein GCM10017788_48370 [Amycolatopsis acidiphila]